MRNNLNFAALAGLPAAEARTELFNGIKGALLMMPMMLDLMGTTRAVKAAASGDERITGPDLPAPTLDEVKAYLVSGKAARFMGGTKWAVPADNPALVQTGSNMIQFFHENIRDIDIGWQALFDYVDMMGSNQDHFDLITTSLGFTWEQMKPGGAIKPRREIAEGKTSVGYLTVGEGFSLLDDYIRFNKFYVVAEILSEFYGTYWDQKASLHYSLITGIGAGIDVNFATDAQTTFNAAAAKILRAADGKGYSVGSNAQLDILVSPEKSGLILSMLDAQRGSPMVAYGVAKQPVAFSVRNVIVSTKVSASDTGYYLVLPGRKLKRADWTALTIESKREPSVSAEDWYGRGQYNAIVGDQAQIARVKYA